MSRPVPQLDVTVGDHRLRLMADRAAWWPAAKTLLVADVHFGKAATFRAAGIAVPEAVAHDLARLDALLRETGADRLVILGDMFHAAAGRTDAVQDQLRQWRARRRRLQLMLVRGNHDRSAGDPPDDLHITCVDEPHDLADLALAHDPGVVGGDAAGVAGHLHPAVALRDVGRTPLRLPCFVHESHRLTLPAFGSFTGMRAVNRQLPAIAISPAGLVPLGHRRGGEQR